MSKINFVIQIPSILSGTKKYCLLNGTDSPVCYLSLKVSVFTETFSYEILWLLALWINSESKIHSILNCAVGHMRYRTCLSLNWMVNSSLFNQTYWVDTKETSIRKVFFFFHNCSGLYNLALLFKASTIWASGSFLTVLRWEVFVI